MKKSVVFLIAALTFFIGFTGGIISGFVFAPIKKGFTMKISVNSNVNLSGKKAKKRKKQIDGHREFIKNIPAMTQADDKKKRKGRKKWIGQK